MTLKEQADSYPVPAEQHVPVAEPEGADFVQVRYTDVPGRFLAKYLCTDSDDPLGYFKNGIGTDGSSVRGFATIDDSDMILLPDKSTLRLMPALSQANYRVATVIADVYKGFGKGRLEKDPRYVAQRMEEHLLNVEGLSCQVGPEVECFIFDDIVFGKTSKVTRGPEIISGEQIGKYPVRRKGGYDAPPSQDSLVDFRFEVAEILRKYYLIKVTNLNHEVASSGQIEINFTHSALTRAADNVQLFKDVVRNVAKKHDKVANFMPKPIFDEKDSARGDNGSGMHTSISLWARSGGASSNVFFDADDSYAELSQTGRYFIGGILEHASSLAALAAPTVNSYRRLVPGFEAPVYAAWSRGNRSAVLRVPVNERSNFKSKRVEFRAPDPSANPYLAFSTIVAAGLDGIKKKMDPGDPVDRDIYKMSESARRRLGIRSLPGSLKESLDALESDQQYLKICMPTELTETYLKLKWSEVAECKSKNDEFALYYDV